MGNFHRDIRQGVRILVKNPVFTLAAAVSLGLAIGANSAIFSMFNSLLWRPLAVESPGRLATVYSRTGDAPFYDAFSWLDYRDYAGDQRVFDGVAAYTVAAFALGGTDVQNAMLYGEAVSGNYFQVVKPRLQLGRGFLPEEGQTAGRDPVVVLADRFWRRQFAADRSVIGRNITLNNIAFTVVGVAEPGFHGIYAIYFAPDVWVPVTMLPRMNQANATMLDDRGNRTFRMMGRLRPDVTIDQAAAAMKTISRRLAATYPKTNKELDACVFAELNTRPEVEIAGGATTVALIFLAFTTLVLLIACANVANLLLSRAGARQKEIAMRLALGATRGRLIRQLLTESIILSLVAGAFGLVLGYLASRLMATVRVPTDLPLVFDFHTDLRVVLFTVGMSVLAGVVFGLIPALQASRNDLVTAMKATTAEPTRRRFSLSSGLVVTQVAVSLALLVVAGLFLKSITGARTIDPGFRRDRLVLMSLNPGLIGYDPARTATFYRVLRDRVKTLPGIESATLAHYVPLDFSSDGGDMVIEGRAAEPGRHSVQSLSSVVDADYFRTLGTRIVEGRAFDERDTATSRSVIIVNQTFARRYWPGQSPIGKRVRFDTQGAPWLHVVGVAVDGKYRQLVESQRDYFFVPYSQNLRPTMTLALLTKGDPAGAIASVRREVAHIDPDMPVFEVKTIDQFMERSYLAPRLSAMLIAPAGILALIIAAVGLYGVMAYSVSRRTRELGIRVAIGAAPGSIVALVMRQGLTLAAAGVVIGLALALAAGRVVSWLLFGVTPTDPGVLIGIPLLLTSVAALATYIPARRALNVDPLVALRQE